MKTISIYRTGRAEHLLEVAVDEYLEQDETCYKGKRWDFDIRSITLVDEWTGRKRQMHTYILTPAEEDELLFKLEKIMEAV